ncbi:hypothetical protein IV203_019664 [Nitzschia inconspicua]|uniref:Uncharacterized protein n=1 Tax=Nitzschia inconspicua TaxID=303405 RepID=A0A9K3LZQ2_9STRA|nr:hypothetical protein IV203_019664 [Nitzschia inconspicua]
MKCLKSSSLCSLYYYYFITAVPIKYLQPTSSRKTLGCYKSPAGKYKLSLQAITENAMGKTALVAKSVLDPKCIVTTKPWLICPPIPNDALKASRNVLQVVV